jgi:hypothetical protein
VKFLVPVLACALLVPSALAAERPAFRYKPPASQEHAVVVEAAVGPQNGDIALKLRFNKQPWGLECGNRCANATVLIDTDDNTSTGLQLPGKAPETGADLALHIQGAREYGGEESNAFVRVKVRMLSRNSRRPEQGELLAELDHRHDTRRLYVEKNTVFLLVDATNSLLPLSRRMRVIYRPPASRPLVATVPGTLSGSTSGQAIFRPDR